jgi:hypothetical protein
MPTALVKLLPTIIATIGTEIVVSISKNKKKKEEQAQIEYDRENEFKELKKREILNSIENTMIQANNIINTVVWESLDSVNTVIETYYQQIMGFIEEYSKLDCYDVETVDMLVNKANEFKTQKLSEVYVVFQQYYNQYGTGQGQSPIHKLTPDEVEIVSTPIYFN